MGLDCLPPILSHPHHKTLAHRLRPSDPQMSHDQTIETICSDLDGLLSAMSRVCAWKGRA